MTHKRLTEITKRIEERSRPTRDAYESLMKDMQTEGVKRAHLTCGNQAHAYAAMGEDKNALLTDESPNIGIVTAYNDMLSAHQPFETYPQAIKAHARELGATAQVAGGVPAMCDGVTQGQVAMELSLFSRDVIAQSAAIALSHNVYDASMFLGVCDKIVPGLIIAAASFGHIPTVFVPAGPMTSGIPNDEKSAVRKKFAAGEIGREELMKAEMASYHSAGTCTFYGTANTNQMLMEFMGLHLPGASFVNPGTEMRDALTRSAVEHVLKAPATWEILSVKTVVNGMVGLMATGGSTNLLLHLIAMARSAGVVINWQDMAEISEIVPLMARVYPNGLADVNHFHAAGGLGFMIGSLLDHGLLHGDTKTIFGEFANYSKEPRLQGDKVTWVDGAKKSLNEKILKSAGDAFQSSGGLSNLSGNLGNAVMKVSAVDEDKRIVVAPARVFHDQDEVKAAFKAGEFTGDTVIVVRFQGPRANGMPELHSLTPVLTILQDRGHKIALVTDGRMSGASGKVPAAIHVSPEALNGGPIASIQDGDMIRVDAVNGVLETVDPEAVKRPAVQVDLSKNRSGFGRELFAINRANAAHAELGASIFFQNEE